MYILINAESQRATARKAASALLEHGILVPFIKVNRNSPDETTLKYFPLDADEKIGADRVARILRDNDIDVDEPEAMPVPRDRSAFRPRHYELWLHRLAQN